MIVLNTLKCQTLTVGRPGKTHVKYTPESELPNASLDIIGELTSQSIPYREYAEEIVIGENVTKIGERALFGCRNILSLSIGENVTFITSRAFGECTGLVEVTIPNSVKTIEFRAFEQCTSLESVVIEPGITSIGTYAFYNCPALRSITFLGKTIEQVQAMSKYPWGIADTSIINVA